METKFNQLNNVDEIINFVNEHENNHTYYCHYSSLSNINKILENECLWLSKLDEFNDKKDKCAEENNDHMYGLCFSALFSENLPMWYLYGGVTGKGARITFKKSNFRKWLDNVEVVLIERTTGKKLERIYPLKIETHDIIYASLEDDKTSCRIKYNGGVNKNITPDEYDELWSKRKGFIKELPWFYEKEFRLMVYVNNKVHEMLIDNDYKLGVELKSEIFNTFDIMLGPESVIKDFSMYKGYEKFLNQKIKKSSFNSIKMGLLNKNKESIVEEISQWLDDGLVEDVCKFIHNKNKCTDLNK